MHFLSRTDVEMDAPFENQVVAGQTTRLFEYFDAQRTKIDSLECHEKYNT
jgi:hypothetical protein